MSGSSYSTIHYPITIDEAESSITLGDSNVTKTSNSALNDPDNGTMIKLVRNGTSDESYGARANIALTRYEDPGNDEARSQLHIRLNHDANTTVDEDQFQFKSNGDFVAEKIIINEVNKAPGTKFKTFLKAGAVSISTPLSDDNVGLIFTHDTTSTRYDMYLNNNDDKLIINTLCEVY